MMASLHRLFVQATQAQATQLGPVEEDFGIIDVNTSASFQRAAHSILGRPSTSTDRATLPVFGRGQHAAPRSVPVCPAGQPGSNRGSFRRVSS